MPQLVPDGSTAAQLDVGALQQRLQAAQPPAPAPKSIVVVGWSGPLGDLLVRRPSLILHPSVPSTECWFKRLLFTFQSPAVCSAGIRRPAHSPPPSDLRLATALQNLVLPGSLSAGRPDRLCRPRLRGVHRGQRAAA